MIDSDTWWRWLRRLAAGVAIAFVLLGTVYNGLRTHDIDANMRDLARLRSDVDSLRMAYDTSLKDATARVDEIERVLFGDVVARIQRPPLTSQVELWQRNRDKELRDRIQRLERWRSQWDN